MLEVDRPRGKEKRTGQRRSRVLVEELTIGTD